MTKKWKHKVVAPSTGDWVFMTFSLYWRLLSFYIFPVPGDFEFLQFFPVPGGLWDFTGFSCARKCFPVPGDFESFGVALRFCGFPPVPYQETLRFDGFPPSSEAFFLTVFPQTQSWISLYNGRSRLSRFLRNSFTTK